MLCNNVLFSYNQIVMTFTQTPYLLSLLLAIVSTSCAAVEPTSAQLKPRLQSGNQLSTTEVSSTEENWTGRAREVLFNALSLTGTRYKFGGNSPETGFDCSGFVRYVYQQATSLTLPRSAIEISKLGIKVSKDKLQPGDLVFFNTLKSTFSHVGIYLGDNRFIHSPSNGGTVRIENMRDGYWARRFNGAQRMDEKP